MKKDVNMKFCVKIKIRNDPKTYCSLSPNLYFLLTKYIFITVGHLLQTEQQQGSVLPGELSHGPFHHKRLPFCQESKAMERFITNVYHLPLRVNVQYLVFIASPQIHGKPWNVRMTHFLGIWVWWLLCTYRHCRHWHCAHTETIAKAFYTNQHKSQLINVKQSWVESAMKKEINI